MVCRCLIRQYQGLSALCGGGESQGNPYIATYSHLFQWFMLFLVIDIN